EQAAVHGRGELSGNAFASEERGNFWSDYAGFDRDGDGMGDLPYEARSLFESLLAREPNLRLFVHSPAQQAIEFTSRALPEMRPEPKFIDPRPLMAPPAAPAVALVAAGGGSGGSRSALLAAGGGLVGSAGIMLGVALRRPGLKGGPGGGDKGVERASTWTAPKGSRNGLGGTATGTG